MAIYSSPMSDNFSEDTIIEAICNAFGSDDSPATEDIPKQQVLEWMHSSSLKVRGCVYAMIVEEERAKHIKPALQFEDYYEFVVPYLEQCIERDPDTEWTESRYLAGHALVVWIVNFWESEAVPREKLAEIKSRLAALYRRGDESVRTAVVNAILEHLFENRSLAEYFGEWKADPVLASAYNDALLWTQENPSSIE